jgi:5-methylthioadenosine/S-adenosylhomocysteine deaminase
MDIYRARWVIPVEAPPIEHGFLAVEDGRIIAVGAADQLAPGDFKSAVLHELGDVLLLPGFVNAHAHFELSCYQNRLPPGPLWPWLEKLIGLRRGEHAPEQEREAVRTAAAESLAAGVTTVGDISRTGLAATIMKGTPLRKVCFIELISGASQPPHDAASLKKAFDEAAADAEADRLLIGISPHAPYTVTEGDLSRVAALAQAVWAPLTMHLLETCEESQWLDTGGGDLADFLERHQLPNAAARFDADIVEILEQTGILACRPLLAHVNYATDGQLDRLARSEASVVWCPRAHRFFGHADHRWREMLARRINVCIGTDSGASTPSLSILDELRHVYQQAPDVQADLILEMGTIRGAAGLGLNHVVGSLRPGKRADFVAVPVEADGPAEPVSNLLSARTLAAKVWIDGLSVGR